MRNERETKVGTRPDKKYKITLRHFLFILKNMLPLALGKVRLL